MPLKLGRRKKRQSFSSDQLIKDYSKSHCPCELYFPEPSVKLDEFGAIKEVCLSGETLQWSKHCILHVCEVPGLSPSSQVMFDDAGQECEICLSAVLSQTKNNFSYKIRDKFWHEYSHKTGDIWRHFFFKFNEEEENKYLQLEDNIKNILQFVNSIEGSKAKKTYLLLAVQTKLEKRKSSLSSNRNSRLSVHDLHLIDSDTNLPPTTEDSSSSGDYSPVIEDRGSPVHFSLTAPFDPAPFVPADWLQPAQDKGGNSVLTSIKTNDSAVLKSITNLCDSLHIHPNELPQTLGSILKSAKINSDDHDRSHSVTKNTAHVPDGKTVVKKCPNDETVDRLASEYLQTEELYIPMGFAAVDNKKTDQKVVEDNRNMAQQSQNNPRVQQSQNNPRMLLPQEAAQLLQKSINSNDSGHAQEYAKQLADDNNVTVTIDVKLRIPIPHERDKEFDLKVNIEDKESSGGTITLKVKASNTIRDLKNTMLRKHMFPLEVQYWIIGKRIPNDHETLERCKIKNHGFTAFLYLISAKAAGLNKEDFMRQNVQDLAQTQTPQTPAPNAEIIQARSRPASTATPGSGATSSASTGKPKLEPPTLDPNINVSGRNEKRTPEKLPIKKSPKVKHEPNIGRPSIEEVEYQMGGLMVQGNDTPYGESRQRVPVMHPEENEEPQQGWACPSCTFINKPTRPGCELCAMDRPADYEIPADYQLTEEEKRRIEMEAIIEKQTREVQPGSQGRKYDSDSERDLDNLLQFHDALQDTLQRMPSKSPEQNSPRSVQGTNFRRGTPGEIDSESESFNS